MKIFVSSLISGMEQERAAVQRAIKALGHEPIMAENFGARPTSSQIACLDGVRQADLVVLVLGAKYGVRQQSGTSATHEEYAEAQGRKTVLMFLQEGISPDPDQARFIAEVGSWETGGHRETYSSAETLSDKVIGALHKFELAHIQAPLDPEVLQTTAASLLPTVDRDRMGGSQILNLAIAVGPRQTILRPAEIEQSSLATRLSREAVYGDVAIFDPAHGTQAQMVDGALQISQTDRRTQARIQLWESGDIFICLPLPDQRGTPGLSALIEEDVHTCFERAIAYTAWMVDELDPTQRLTHVCLAARIDASEYEVWRSKAEHAASPRRMSVPMGVDPGKKEPVWLSPSHRPRAALSMDAKRMTEDLVTLLRRRWKG